MPPPAPSNSGVRIRRRTLKGVHVHALTQGERIRARDALRTRGKIDETDIFLAYEHRLPKERAKTGLSGGVDEVESQAKRLSKDEQTIYELLLEQPRSVDELEQQSGMTFGLLQSVLLSLLIKRRINQQPGSIYKVF